MQDNDGLSLPGATVVNEANGESTISDFDGNFSIIGNEGDILIASFLGSGPVAEAFIVAFTLPNMFRRLFAEGAFSSAFVPTFTGAKNRSEEEGLRLLATMTVILFSITGLAKVICSIVSPNHLQDNFLIVVVLGIISFEALCLLCAFTMKKFA